MAEFWFSSSIGRRPTMEDTHVVAEDVKSGWQIYAVCDGHGGRAVVNEVKNVLAPFVLTRLARASIANEGLPLRPGYLRQFLKGVIVKIDRHLNDVIKGSARASGSTLILMIFQPRTRQIAIANVGDSRAALQLDDDIPELATTGGGGTLIETRDHKPTDADEVRRVQAAGSEIVRKRVGGILAMTRALGDFSLKRARRSSQAIPAVTTGGGSKRVYDPLLGPVSALPDVQVGAIGPGVRTTAVLACDGIWDVMKTPEAVKLAGAAILAHQHPAQSLVDEAYRRDSSDNLTALVVHIPPQRPRISPRFRSN